MDTQWFLGANTAQGFVSRFEQLQSDSRVKELIILKGGPGCGKSTFMKRLRKAAQQLGGDTESFLCSSDPDSLDGLLILPIGLAIVDGTAPHVLEPKLCCCDGTYLNLGCFYDADGVKAERKTLEALRKEHQALYPAIYAHLSAAAALQTCAGNALSETDAAGLYALMRTLVQESKPSETGHGQNRERFLHAYTPSGKINCTKSICSTCRTQVAIIDPFGMSAAIFARLRAQYIYENYDVISILDPLRPERMAALLIPEEKLAYLACEAPTEDCTVMIPLSHYFAPSEAALRLKKAKEEHCTQAVALLKQAKATHDEMEKVYRPYVSFEGLDLLTQEYEKKIKAEFFP